MKIGDSLEMVEDSNLNSTISGKKLKVLHFFYNLFESSIFFNTVIPYLSKFLFKLFYIQLIRALMSTKVFCKFFVEGISTFFSSFTVWTPFAFAFDFDDPGLLLVLT